MGELIDKLVPYFVWTTAYHRAVGAAARIKILRNQIAALRHAEPNPHVKRRYDLVGVHQLERNPS